MYRLILILALLLPLSATADEVAGLLQLLDYVGVDYREAVRDGEVIHAGEYAEMQEFTATISEEIAGLPDRPPELAAQSRKLQQLVEAQAEPAKVAELAADLRQQIIVRYEVATVPHQPPAWQRAEALYAAQCASCHGAEGRGDGAAGAALEPPPTDFTDAGRRAQRSLYGLYNTITLGVPETGMEAFGQLDDATRWSLAFYVARLGADPAVVAAGKKVAEQSDTVTFDLMTVTTLAPAEAQKRFGEREALLLAYLRSHPDALFAGREAPLTFAARRLEESLAAYRQGEREQAYQFALEGYLDGYELAEASVATVDRPLARKIEGRMADYRNAVRQGVEVEALAQMTAELTDSLTQAERLLQGGGLSPAAAYTGSLVILLREGLEALLVIAALGAFLVKTGRRDALPYLHAGWIAAIAAGGLTWWVSTHLITIGGAQRELTEAVAAVVAAVVLFYVGFWMHSKTQAVQWKHFIEGQIRKALSKTTLWSLTALAFITVYREAFETVLFYQALWLQAEGRGQGMVLAGMGTAVAALLLVAWLAVRYSLRLPLRQFFGVSGALILLLAVIFAGKGIAAFQEAGLIAQHPVPLPTIELLGLYPNLEGIAVQAGMVLLALLLLYVQRRSALSG